MRLLLFAFLAFSLATQAQRTIISVGNAPSLLIKSGFIFSADSLVLTPGADFTLSSNSIQVSPVPVAIAPSPSIARVYYLASQVTFTGTIQLYYQPSELNGNPESSLKYTDSALSGFWFAYPSSSVNTSLHYVQQAAAAQSFIGATASHQGVVLPLLLISFSGNWEGDQVKLEWTVDQKDEPANFALESSTDGYNWNKIGERAGTWSNGVFTYDFMDASPSSNIMFYRIDILHFSGQVTHSFIVKVQKDISNNVRLVSGGNSMSVYFSGVLPTGIRLIDVPGRIIWSDMSSRQQYNVTSLFPGAYFLQYQIAGQWVTKQ